MLGDHASFLRTSENKHTKIFLSLTSSYDRCVFYRLELCSSQQKFILTIVSTTIYPEIEAQILMCKSGVYSGEASIEEVQIFKGYVQSGENMVDVKVII